MSGVDVLNPGHIKGRWREWILLDGSRLAIAGGLAVGLYLAFVAVDIAGVVLRRAQPLYYLFGGLISGNLTLITVVVTISQFLLSRELRSPNELRTEIDGVIDYRTDVEEAANRIAPVDPLGFLRLLFENTRMEAQKLGGLTINVVEDRDVAEELDDLVEQFTGHADEIDQILLGSDIDTFDVLSVTLTTNYARQINRIRQLRSRHGDHLSDDILQSTERLINRLQEIDIARQYFKAIYLQEELSELSRLLFYVGIPAETVVAFSLFTMTSGPDWSVLVNYHAVALPAVITVGFLPLIVLCSYVIRITTVTQRTAATIPFTTPRQEK